MSINELSEQDQYDFSVLYGALFSLALSSEYLDALAVVVKARGSNYVLNKCRDAEKANDTLLKVIRREFTKTMSPENKAITLQAIEDQKAFVYDIFLMDAEDQRRIKSLITKLKKEKK